MKKQLTISLALVIILLTILACSLTPAATPTIQPAPVPTQGTAPTQAIAPTLAFDPTQIFPTLVETTQAQPTVEVPTQALTQPATVLDGQALVADRCTTCHGLNKVQRKYPAADWQFIVADMVDRGADLKPAEQAAVIKYLATTYGQ